MNTSGKKTKIVLLWLGIVLFAMLLVLYRCNDDWCPSRSCTLCSEIVNTRDIHKDPTFFFVPENVTNCKDLFTTPRGRNFRLPATYRRRKAAFDHYFKKHLPEGAFVEGHVDAIQEMTYYSIANYTNVKRVCETGFNAGHSTFQWLVANENVIVHSFDLGWHSYSKGMAAYLQASFPNRLHVYWGDSTDTVPRLREHAPDLKCDIAIVDGGHTYEAAYADLKNMEKMVNPERHLIVVDDNPGSAGTERAWKEFKEQGRVTEIFRCCRTFFPLYTGFTIGRYNIHRDIGRTAENI